MFLSYRGLANLIGEREFDVVGEFHSLHVANDLVADALSAIGPKEDYRRRAEYAESFQLNLICIVICRNVRL